jgi:hypothetical protein
MGSPPPAAISIFSRSMPPIPALSPFLIGCAPRPLVLCDEAGVTELMQETRWMKSDAWYPRRTSGSGGFLPVRFWAPRWESGHRSDDHPWPEAVGLLSGDRPEEAIYQRAWVERSNGR